MVVGAISGAYFTWRQITVTREGQITDRFTKAIGQVGDDKITIRLGGIYALERITRDSPKDQWTIVETLAAFVRETVPASSTSSTGIGSSVSLRTDVQAALTVLGRRNSIDEPGSRIDLSRTNLAGADLRGAHFKSVDFDEAY